MIHSRSSHALLLLLRFACCLASCLAPVCRADVLNDSANFNIPAQPVRTALIEFSKQADVQVMGRSAALSGLCSTEVKGRLRARDALSQLLLNTGLRYESMRHAVVVKSITTARARVPEVKARIDDPEGPTTSATVLPARDSGDVDLESLGPAIVVTGTHIHGSDMVGSRLIVIDRQSIARSGYTTVQEVVRSLPQVFGGGASEDTVLGTEANANTARSTALNLRGLGAGATLVLVDGHRLAMSGSQASFVDVSTLPLSAVARIEILTDGASAIYGSDAVGGVINFIMRDDYQGAETRAQLGTATEGRMQETALSQLLGTRWSTGHVTASYEYIQRDPLRAADRRQTRSSDLRPLGGSNFNSAVATPGNIIIGTTTYAIPGGQDGTDLMPADLAPGTLNRRNINEGRDQLAGWTRHSGFLSASQSLGDLVTLSGNALYSFKDVTANNGGQPFSFSVPASNPFRVLPAGVVSPDSYRVQYNFGKDLGQRLLDLQTRSFSTAAGVAVRLPRHWELDGSVSYSNETVDQLQANSVSSSALSAALADPDPSTAFNPFGDGTANNPATLGRLRASTLFLSDSNLKGASAILSGGLFRLPGGEVRLAAGSDFRRQFFQSRSRSANATVLTSNPAYDRDVTAGFAELLVPIVSRANEIPGIADLQLSVAARHDQYSDFGGTLNPRFGIDWTLWRGLAVRASLGRSFKAPNLPDLDDHNNQNFIEMVPDPRSASGASPVLVWQGGNPGLKPETAHTWVVGVRWTPDVALKPSVDLSWFDIEFRDRVQSLAADNDRFLVDFDRYVGVVTLDPTQAQREAVCARSNFLGNISPFPGDCRTTRIAAIVDARSNNTAITKTRGLNLSSSLDAENSWGRFEVNSNIDYLLQFEQAQTPTAVPLSIIDSAGNPLRFRMSNGVAWARSGFGVTASVHYAGAYRDTVSKPNRRVDSWTTLDLQLSYETDAASGWLAGASVALNVQNLFDTQPPFVNDPTGVGYDRENADLINRFIALRVQKQW